MDDNSFNPESYSEYNNKPLSPLERLRRMEEELILKHQKSQPKKHNTGFKTKAEKPRKRKPNKGGNTAGNYKYGLPRIFQVKRHLTSRAIRFLELMGGLDHFVETLAQAYEFKNPDLFKDLPDKPPPKNTRRKEE